MSWDDEWNPQKETFSEFFERNSKLPRGTKRTKTSIYDRSGQSDQTNKGFDEYIDKNPAAKDAWAYLEALLSEYDLDGLIDFAKDAIIQGYSANEIVQRIRTTDIYKKRFKVIEDRKAQGLPAVSEAEVIAYEKQATTLMRAAGLPKGFWDTTEDFYKLQMADISVAELDSRINQGYMKIMQAPQDVRDEWKVLGYTDGDLAAAFLDDTKTEALLQERLGASQRSAQAVRSGFGGLNAFQAEQLAKLGISDSEASSGFSDLVAQHELMNNLPGLSNDHITRQEQLEAQFGGNVFQQQRIKRTAEERVAAGQRGGGFVSGREGAGGIGEAR